jgi:OPA family glycerol-3-phosphate transporter-like MFS transporter
MAASVVCTFAFGLTTGIAAWTVIWCANRFVQSAGWGAALKISGVWFDATHYGRAVAILSMSYLFGDVVARLALGRILAAGASWQQMFFGAGAILLGITGIVLFILRSRPQDVGLPPAVGSAASVFGADGDHERPAGLGSLLAPLLKSFSFWLVCMMSFGLTLIRETFNFWTPSYLAETAGMSADQAATASSLFPFFGGLSVLLTGFLSDTLGKGRRAGIMLLFLAPGAAAMVGLGALSGDASATSKLVLVSLVGFLLIGPYSFLAGAISLDMASKRGAATAAGMIDAVGYLGSILSGAYVGALAQRHGWGSAFGFLGAISIATAVAAAMYWLVQERTSRAASRLRASHTGALAPLVEVKGSAQPTDKAIEADPVPAGASHR